MSSFTPGSDRHVDAAATTVSELLDALTLEELKAMRAEIVRRIEEGGRDLRRIEQALKAKRTTAE